MEPLAKLDDKVFIVSRARFTNVGAPGPQSGALSPENFFYMNFRIDYEIISVITLFYQFYW